MIKQRLALCAAACVIAAMVSTNRVSAEEPGCATNYRTDGTSAETFVLTSLNPQAVVERLPRLLMRAGLTIQWTEPANGIIKAQGLDVKAETSGEATRVTFRSSRQPVADKDTLCRYAVLVGDPPVAKKIIAQDPALIARMQDDLLKRHQIIQPDLGEGLNNAQFVSLSDFLEFVITDKRVGAGKQEYEVSMLVPRASCGIAGEDNDDSSMGMTGHDYPKRTKPARLEVKLVYEGEGTASHLTEAFIIHIESSK